MLSQPEARGTVTYLPIIVWTGKLLYLHSICYNIANVANLQLMFPDTPVQGIELILKDSIDFVQALEVVFNRFGNKTTPHQDTTRNIPSREAEDIGNEDLCSDELPKILYCTDMSVCIPSFLGNSN